MSQQTVESVIGRLVTDEAFRRRFRERPTDVLDDLVENGVALTSVERRALAEMDAGVCERFAGCIDPRLRKISLRGNGS
jgi:hypothetical protein